MKKPQPKKPNPNKGILSTINDKPDPKVEVKPSNKNKGVISKLNDDPEEKE